MGTTFVTSCRENNVYRIRELLKNDSVEEDEFTKGINILTSNNQWETLVDILDLCKNKSYILRTLPLESFKTCIQRKKVDTEMAFLAIRTIKDKFEYLIESDPQSCLLFSIRYLDEVDIPYSISMGAKVNTNCILEAIYRGQSHSYIKALLEYEISPKDLHLVLEISVKHRRKDLILILSEKIGYDKINFKLLYDKCYDRGLFSNTYNSDMGSFIDRIVEAHIS